MFFKKRNQSVRKCPNGHIMDPDWDKCPYCAGQQSSVFLDESRADQRAVSSRGDLPPMPPMPPLPPPPPPPPPPPASAAAHRAAPSHPPASASDPDVTQISRPGPSAPPPASPAQGSTPQGGPHASPHHTLPPPPQAPGPPPLVEFTDARGRPAPPPAAGSPTAAPRTPPPAVAGRSSPHVPGSLDEPTRILSAATGAGLTVAWLVAVSGPWRGQDFRIQPGGARIGRIPSCGICLPQGQDLGLSKEHAEVRFGAGACNLVDLGSANGTFVNDERVTERALQDGDRVRFGLLEFVYKCLVL